MKGEWLRKSIAGEATAVFVHGILSSGENCWRHDNGAYWPELLKNEPGFESLGIYVYTYQTGFTSGSYSLSDVVDDLKERLVNLDKVLDSNPILFVCHSMGGIVVRKFIVERCQDLLDRNNKIGLYLVASPSLGSDYANWLEPIAKAAGHAQARALRISQDNQWLNDLDKTFQNLKESRRLSIYGKELLEDKFVILKSFFRKQVVEHFSGNRYFGESYKVPGSDHFSISKPENNQADQHRLLLKFIEQLLPIKAAPSKLDISSISSLLAAVNAPDEKAEVTTQVNKLQPWQIKLKTKLLEQLKHPGLQQIVDAFIGKLIANNPALENKLDSIALFLVKDESDRPLQIAQFLSSVKQYPPSEVQKDQVQTFLSYLLQTLVRKCREENDQGLTRVPVEKKQTIEMISASRTTTPYIPDYSEAQSEHTNGQRNAKFQNIGHFIPTTGEFKVHGICQHIAKDLLINLGFSAHESFGDALETLNGTLRAYRDEPENSPLQALYLKHDSGHNPLQIKAVADTFGKRLNDLIWIYVYGGDNADDWLYGTETELRGLVDRFERETGSKMQTSQRQTEEHTMNKSTPPITAGDHNIINIVQGDQTGSQVGQDNVQLNQNVSAELLQALQNLKQSADQSPDVTKQQYADIVKTADAVEQEIQKEQGADKGILMQANKTLDSLKNIAGITGSIEKISQLLIPLLG